VLALCRIAPATAHAHQEEQGRPVTSLEGKCLALPFRYDPLLAPGPLVQIRINDAEPLWFLVDTGLTSRLRLEEWAVRKLGLRYTKGTIYSHTTKKRLRKVAIGKLTFVTTRPKDTFEFQLPDASVSESTPFLDHLYGKGKVAGILGVGALDQVIAQFDFACKELRLMQDPDYQPPASPNVFVGPLLEFERPGESAPSPKSAQTVQDDAHQTAGKRNGTGEYYALVTIAGVAQPMPFLVDTGAMDIGLCLPGALMAGARTIGKPTTRVYTTAAGSQKTNYHLLESVRANGAVINRVPAIESTDTTEMTQMQDAPGTRTQIGLLGSQVLSLFLVTLDFPHQRLILEPRSGDPKAMVTRAAEATDDAAALTLAPQLRGMSVFALKEAKGGFVIGPGSMTPADAGAKPLWMPGDRIESVDGKALAGLPISAAQALLDGWAGTPAKVVIKRRDNKRLTITYQRRDYWTAPAATTTNAAKPGSKVKGGDRVKKQ
jgi:predicted aspartyl protease